MSEDRVGGNRTQNSWLRLPLHQNLFSKHTPCAWRWGVGRLALLLYHCPGGGGGEGGQRGQGEFPGQSCPAFAENPGRHSQSLCPH